MNLDSASFRENPIAVWVRSFVPRRRRVHVARGPVSNKMKLSQ